MAALLPPAECQFIDANGDPYAGGSLATLIPGTATPKDTWQDAAGTVLNTNPITLDSAGRAIVYGDGLFRTILKDAAGNLIWDQASSTLVSAAMAPVVIAPTIAEAVRLLGIADSIDAAVATETARAEAAEAAEASARANADNAEITARTNADTALGARVDAEISRAEAAEAALSAEISGIGVITGPVQTRTGTFTSNPVDASFSITFATPFASACLTVQGHGAGVAPQLYYLTLTDSSGFPVLPTASGATGHAWGYTGGAGEPAAPAAATDFVYTATGF